MKIKTIKNLKNLKGKKVIVRCDFNVPLKNGKILDDFRIKAAFPTIKYLLSKKAQIILISHLGDPGGKKKEELSLKPIANYLRKKLRVKVSLLEDIPSQIPPKKEKTIFLLENIRFWEGEEKCDLEFAKKIAKLGEIFVNEAFSASHRKHASLYLLAKLLPSYLGICFENELKNLEKFLKSPKKPLICLIGGKKIETKAPLIEKFLEMADWILVNHLIWHEIKEKMPQLKDSSKIIYPIDGVNENLDIGPKTIQVFEEKIRQGKTIFWNGPFGKVEEKKYQEGTKQIAKIISKVKALSIVGGGETIEFLNSLKLIKKFTFVSTGGGAMLEFLSGKKLPALEVLGYYGT